MLHHIMGCHTDVSRDCEWAVENGVNGPTVLFKNLFGFLQSNLLLPGSAWGAVYLLKGRRSRRVREQLTSPGNAGAQLCPNYVKLKGSKISRARLKDVGGVFANQLCILSSR